MALSRLIERDASGIELWQTPSGRFWIPSGSETVLPILLAEQASRVYEWPGRVEIKNGDTVFDCGAHIGVFTRKALSDGASLVVAIEPSPLNLECLRRNVAKEIAEGRVVVIPEGLWDRPDLLSFFTNPENSAGDSFLIRSPRSSDTVQVRVTTLDTIPETHRPRESMSSKSILRVPRNERLGVPSRRLANLGRGWLFRQKRKPTIPSKYFVW